MKKFTILLVIIFAIYFVYKIFDTSPDKLSSNFSKKELSGNFIERVIAQILINVLNTDQGQRSLAFLSNSLQHGLEKFVSKNFEKNFEKVSHYLVPLYFYKTDKRGKGPCIICGQKFKAKYQIMDKDMKNILLEKEEESVLGSKKILNEINVLMPGMKKGETIYSMLGSSSVNQDLQSKNIMNQQKLQKIFIKLTDIEYNEELINIEKTYIFDSQLVDINLEQERIICGDKISFQFQIVDLISKKVIFDSKEKIFSNFVGSAELPVIFNYALHKKPLKGTRSIICDGKYLNFNNKNLLSFSEKKLTIIDENIYMLVIYNTSFLTIN